MSDWLPPRMSNDSNPADGAALDVLDHLGEGVAPLDIQTAFAFVGVLCVDLHPPALRVLPDDVHLVAGRVLLVLGGHANTGGGRDRVRGVFRLASWEDGADGRDARGITGGVRSPMKAGGW